MQGSLPHPPSFSLPLSLSLCMASPSLFCFHLFVFLRSTWMNFYMFVHHVVAFAVSDSGSCSLRWHLISPSSLGRLWCPEVVNGCLKAHNIFSYHFGESTRHISCFQSFLHAKINSLPAPSFSTFSPLSSASERSSKWYSEIKLWLPFLWNRWYKLSPCSLSSL